MGSFFNLAMPPVAALAAHGEERLQRMHVCWSDQASTLFPAVSALLRFMARPLMAAYLPSFPIF